MKLPEIVGISGTHGAGKDTLASLRAERQSCQHVTVSDILRTSLREVGAELSREALIELSTQWREETGDSGTLVTRTVARYFEEKAANGYEGLSVVSLRHPAEVDVIKQHGGIFAWVDADPELRYQRISNGQRSRPEDRVTFEQFIAQEQRELNPPQPSETSVNLGAVRQMADIVILNNFPEVGVYRQFLIDEYEL